MTAPADDTLPDALLLITAGCAHCPVVLDGLTRLVKEAAIGRLQIVNVAAHPEYAEQRGIRSVPWTLLGDFELEGKLNLDELRTWAQLARAPQGMAAYFAHLLGSGQLARCTGMIRAHPERFTALLTLLADPGTSLNVRIGISAALEDLQDTNLIADAVSQLGALTRHADAAVRADACHALAFTSIELAGPYLNAGLTDSDAAVREIATDSLTALKM
jgi:hypothetical protein